MPEQLYQLKITATGEVRDADGNLVEQVPIEETRIVTETEAVAILQAQAQASAEAEERSTP